jgi:hypothetical protein
VAWDVAFTVLGAAIVVYGLSDIFLTLVHPHARGRLTRGIVAGIWRATSRGGRRARAASGPLAAISVVLAWAAIQAIGWAFIYLPHVPDGFSYSEGIDPDLYLWCRCPRWASVRSCRLTRSSACSHPCKR